MVSHFTITNQELNMHKSANSDSANENALIRTNVINKGYQL